MRREYNLHTICVPTTRSTVASTEGVNRESTQSHRQQPSRGVILENEVRHYVTENVRGSGDAWM